MTAEALALRNAPNFRDLGGLATTDGRWMAKGLIYRSEALSGLDDTDWDTVNGIGFRLVCDLRSPAERAKHPVRWTAELPRVSEIALLPDVRTAGAEIMRLIVRDTSGAAARKLLVDNYAEFPAAFEPHFGDLIASIIDHRELPLMIGCTAGKDRTGFVCSVLLRAIGVGREEIVADYLKSNDFFDPDSIRAALAAWLGAEEDSEPSEQVIDALKVHVEYLDSAYAAIDRDYGGVDAYLARNGLDQRRRQQLREVLLESQLK